MTNEVNKINIELNRTSAGWPLAWKAWKSRGI